jgi:hypothetical protein
MTSKKTHEQFIEEVSRLANNEYSVLSQYRGVSEKVEMRHNTCGYIYKVAAGSFLQGIRCPSCANKIRGNHLKTKNEDFITRVKEIVGEEYEFLEDYVSTDYKISVRHNTCGHEYKVRPSGFLRGTRCPICSLKEQTKRQRFSHDEFCNRVKNLVGNDYIVLGEYVNSQTKINMKHVVCGNEFEMLPNNFSRGARCPKCGQERSHKTQTRTHEEFKNIIYNLVKDEYSILGSYVKSEEKVKIRHNVCGYEYEVKPGNFINNNRRCPLCSEAKCGQRRTFPVEKFLERLNKAVGDEYCLVGDYVNTITPVLLKHKNCGQTFKCVPSQFLSGSRCVYCGKMFYKSHEYLKNEVHQLVENEYSVLGEYKGSETKILMRHNKCGHEYMVKPANFLSGKRCPNCKESGGEKCIKGYLKENNLNFVYQYSFPNLKNKRPLKFDFAVLDGDNLKLLIEFDGPQHFKPVSLFGGDMAFLKQIKNDGMKERYCKDRNIPLLRISHDQIKEIKDILDKALSHKAPTIRLDFAPEYNLDHTESIELKDASAFFDFYVSHYDKGIIFNVQEVPDDSNNRPRPPQDEETLRQIDGQAGENSVREGSDPCRNRRTLKKIP